MEKIITIDGRSVPFRATAAIPRLYRIKFGRDIMQDMRDIQQAVEKAQAGEEPIPVKLLEVFENVAYLMARHADPDMEARTVRTGWTASTPSPSTRCSPSCWSCGGPTTSPLPKAKKNESRRPGTDHSPVSSPGGAAGHPHPGPGAAHRRHGHRHADRGGQRRARSMTCFPPRKTLTHFKGADQWHATESRASPLKSAAIPPNWTRALAGTNKQLSATQQSLKDV